MSAAYTLAMSVTLLLGSRVGDIAGRRRALLAGIAGFAATSTLGALAPDPGTLVAARALQGACAALMVPQCFGLIRELFGADGRPRRSGIVGPVMGLGAVCTRARRPPRSRWPRSPGRSPHRSCSDDAGG
ncbi:MAG TPA: MFS transporter [Solirubrobacteraceae bacterium]|nr:MFS transporter [Solirubrobacteraceae bacterium]